MPRDARQCALQRECWHKTGDVAAQLRARGVLIRYYDRPELAGYIRISAGRPEDTARLLVALSEVKLS